MRKFGVKYRQSSLLPGITLIGRPNHMYCTCRWVTPIGAGRTLYFYSFSLFRKRGRSRGLADSMLWLFRLSWVRDWLFSDQDKRALEALVPGKESI